MRLVIVGGVLFLAGLAVFALTLVKLYNGVGPEPQAKAPGTVTAEVDAPGKYYLFDNHWTVYEGKRYSYPSDWPADAGVTVKDAAGEELAFTPDTSRKWSIGNNSKTSVGFVEVTEPTTLTLEIPDTGRERIVTVSNLTMQEDIWARLGGFGVGLILGLVGLPVAVIGLLFGRRRSAAAE